ncbi:MAG: hypothetical protein Ct9H90mP23_1630 [Methanobacteriota archaeon]|nr:MAG: hypothetical protein Ct9H90mP23_1630 [Euryarchaeota archaeon]
MPVKVLKNEGSEIRLRLIGEDHSTLQLFRSRLNANDKVEYANFFTGHPDLENQNSMLESRKDPKGGQDCEGSMFRHSEGVRRPQLLRAVKFWLKPL